MDFDFDSALRYGPMWEFMSTRERDNDYSPSSINDLIKDFVAKAFNDSNDPHP